MNITKIFCCGILVALTTLHGFSQLDSAQISRMTREEILALSQDDLLEMSMENLLFLAQKMGISIDELLNMKTSVASKTTLTPRETPGIVSFIPSEEIRYSGARDLIDVLKMVPGFDFGYDVSGVVGVGLRGNWVHEGKILLLIDGQPMNELSYYNIPFGNHFPVDQIRRVEIIRGPGSAIYGGNAELGVINIITKSGKDVNGVELAGTYGQLEKSMGRANVNLHAGINANEWDFSVGGFYGVANRSDQPFFEYVDDKENILAFSDSGSRIITTHVNVAATNNKLSLRMIYDDYQTEYPYYDYDLMTYIISNDQFRTILGEVKYDAQLSDKITLTPKFNYRYNRPYYEAGYWRNYRVDDYKGSLSINYKANKKAAIVAGMEFVNTDASCLGDGYFYSTLEPDMNFRNIALFGEGTFKLKKVNLVAGFRTEHNNAYGWASAPRVGFTGLFNKFHFKALFSGAFRTPAIGNIDASRKIEPEKSFTSELEVGYRINDNMFITANFYDIQIKNSIVYYDTGVYWEPIVDWGYLNESKAGSDGFDIELKARYTKGFASIHYSFYTQAFRSLPEMYSVPGHSNAALGHSQHQAGINASYMVLDKLAVSPSFSYYGKKYGYTSVDEEGNLLIGAMGPYFQMNLALHCSPVKGISFNLAAYDLFNKKMPFAHPYKGFYAAYPGRSREILLKLVLSTDVFKN